LTTVPAIWGPTCDQRRAGMASRTTVPAFVEGQARRPASETPTDGRHPPLGPSG